MTATILLVDDEEMLRHVMTRALEGYGFRVITASDGVAAWELLQANSQAITAIVTDVRMPRMDGQELAERVATLPNAPPVLFISGYPRGNIPYDQPFLSKPFQADQLVDSIAAVLKRAPVGGSPISPWVRTRDFLHLGGSGGNQLT
jgi:two-component system cell cycle sensor histidine kinase/response regulator CckA